MKKIINLILAVLMVGIFSVFIIGAIDWNDELLAYYALNGTSGVVLDSAPGNLFNGSVEGLDVNQGQAGILNNSFFFNGTTGSGVDIDGFPTSFPQSFSVVMWINSSDYNTQQRFIDRWEVPPSQFRIGSEVDVVEFTVNNLTTRQALSPYPPALNQWVMISVIYNGTHLNLFFNNTLVNYTDMSGDVVTSVNNITIGAANSNTKPAPIINASIDEISIWNKSLTLQEVTDLYNDGLANPFNQNPNISLVLNSPNNDTFITNSSIIFNSTITPVDSEIANATLFVWYLNNNTLFNETTDNLISGTSINSTAFNISFLSPSRFKWNVFSCGTATPLETFCAFAPTNRTFTFGLNEFVFGNSTDLRETDTAVWNITFNVSSGITPTGNFYFNGTRRVGTATNIGGDRWRLDSTFQFGTGIGLKNWFWEIFSGLLTQNTTVTNQLLNATNFTLCNSGTLGTQFLNFSFANETILQENVTAFVSTSTFIFWLGDGTVNKTTTFSTANENRSYEFCGSPLDKTLNVDTFFSYDNSESEQRTFNPGIISLSRATTNQTLFLLPTNEGIFVTFQVTNIAQQPIANALVTLTRSGFGTIAQEITGAAGTVNIFLNPNFQYTLNVQATGFTTFETTQAFPTNEFTIVLGGVGEVTNDTTRDVEYSIEPRDTVLFNQTAVNFNFTINSTFFQLDRWGFTIANSSGDVLNSTSDTTATGGFISVTLNTRNNTGLTMVAFWQIDDVQNNVSRSWLVLQSGDTSFSILQFVTDLNLYLSSGLFGLQNFGLSVILFLVVFISVGVLSFKFGVTSPQALMGLLFGLVAFFDVSLELLPNPIGAIPHFPTVIVGLITLAVVIRGGIR